jgi:hypothetical protein
LVLRFLGCRLSLQPVTGKSSRERPRDLRQSLNSESREGFCGMDNPDEVDLQVSEADSP